MFAFLSDLLIIRIFQNSKYRHCPNNFFFAIPRSFIKTHALIFCPNFNSMSSFFLHNITLSHHWTFFSFIQVLYVLPFIGNGRLNYKSFLEANGANSGLTPPPPPILSANTEQENNHAFCCPWNLLHP